MSQRVMAVDPGEKRLGIAISDPGGVIANPLTVLLHESRGANAQRIAKLAEEHEVILIVVGQALDAEGEVGPQARKSVRLAEAVRQYSSIPVQLWDESGSTQAVQRARLEMGVKRAKRRGHLDDLAAAYLLQSYLDNRQQTNSSTPETE